MVLAADRYLPCEEKVYDGTPAVVPPALRGLTGQRILDVGCGTGNLGAALVTQGNECYGLTISQREAELAGPKLARVVVGDLETMKALPFEASFFDTILCFDVLEHLRNPRQALELLKPCLKPDGKLIASIPNVANIVVRWNLLRGRFDYEREGILDETHLRFYTLGTARRLLESAGFAVRDVQYTNWNWRLPRWIEKPLSFCEWEVRQRMTRWWPGLFATQFILKAAVS